MEAGQGAEPARSRGPIPPARRAPRKRENTLNRNLCVFLVFVVCSLVPALALAGPITLGANLQGGQEVPPVATLGGGTGRVTISDDLTRIDFEVSVVGLADVAESHIHVGGVGENGPVVLFLSPVPFAGTISGTLTAADVITGPGVSFEDLLEEVMRGNTYINVHTSTNPGGEIRGQLAAPESFVAILIGSQEVPAVETLASGVGQFELTDSGLVFDISHTGFATEEIGSHFHRGARGVAGPVALPLPPGNRKVGIADLASVNADDPMITPTQNLADLLGGDLYVNVHSQQFPGGEIRGQIHPRIEISPATSTFTTATPFELTIIADIPPGVHISGATAILDGVNVLPFLSACFSDDLFSLGGIFPLDGIRTGTVFVCGDLHLPAGLHEFVLTLSLSDGSRRANVVEWEVLPVDRLGVVSPRD